MRAFCVPTIAVESLEVGDLWLEGRKMPVVQDVFGGAEGALGTEGLADKRIFIDFKNDAISILRSKRESPPPGYRRIPVELRNGRLLMFEIMRASKGDHVRGRRGPETTIRFSRITPSLRSLRRTFLDIRK